MSEKVDRERRRFIQAASKQAAETVAPAITAALDNEQVTRARVDMLEYRCKALENSVSLLKSWDRMHATRWQRLKWLFASGK